MASVLLAGSRKSFMAKKSEISKFAFVPYACVGAGFLLAVVASLFVVQLTATSDHRQALINAKADSLQQHLDSRLQQIKSQLSGLATSNRLVNAIKVNDPSMISQEEAALGAMVQNTIRVRVFPLGKAEVDRNTTPAFSFTSLDLVNRAEAGEVISFEAINSDGKWIVSIATPIRSPDFDQIQGTLFVYLDSKVLATSLETHINGQLKLLQTAGSATKEVLVLGSGSAPDSIAVERTLSNPIWKMSYTPSIELSESSIGNFVLFLIPSVLFLVLALAGVSIGITRIVKTIRADLSHLDHQIASVAAGHYESSVKYQIGDFADVDVGLTRLGKKEITKGPVPKLDIQSITPDRGMDEMVDIEMLDEDTFDEAVDSSEDAAEVAAEDSNVEQYASIFRAYDIRGIINETLTSEIIHKIGLAIGSEAGDLGQQSILVGADGRVSSPDVMETLITGLLDSGRDVVSVGAVPTPILYFATHNSDTQSGVMITGSHNPSEYNGFKIVLDGTTLVEEDIQKLYQRIASSDFTTGKGELTEIDIKDDYIDAVTDDVVVAQPLKVVIDCGNGIAGDIAPDLISNLGCEVIPLYCEVDGTFPNHPPDPIVPENLEDLVLTVKSQEADLGIAFDGDGDRLVAVTAQGEIIWPDRLLMLFAKDVVSRNPGSDVVYDIKCTRHLNSVISSFGGRPIICRSGHSYVKAKIEETGAVLGGEMSGHICFSERWFGFDDGLYSAARLLEIVGSQMEGLEQLMQEFPNSLATPEIQIQVDDVSKFTIMDQLNEIASFEDATITTIDGIRADYADGWGLVRASNTNPILTLRFEADDKSAMARIKDTFRTQLQAVQADLDFE
jgi:phosphomannomutase / phosphoglucomutase